MDEQIPPDSGSSEAEVTIDEAVRPPRRMPANDAVKTDRRPRGCRGGAGTMGAGRPFCKEKRMKTLAFQRTDDGDKVKWTTSQKPTEI